MDPSVIVIALSGLAGAAYVGWLVGGNRDVRRSRRLLRKTRVTKIAELEDGRLACIVGTVEADADSVESLIERRFCVAFDTITKTPDAGELTVSIRVTRRAVPFFVNDGTGRVRIDAPEVALCNKPLAKSDRFEERIVEDGDRIRIVGSVALEPTRKPTADHLFRQSAFKARLTGTSKYPLLADVEPS